MGDRVESPSADTATSHADALFVNADSPPSSPRLAWSVPAITAALIVQTHSDPTTEIDWLSSILLNPANEKAVRRGAAERLLVMRDEAAHGPLKEALASEDATLMLAVIEAMRDASNVDRAVVTAAAKAMRTVPDDVLEPLASVLAQHNDEALAMVKAMADDSELPDEKRLGPIRALGGFRSRDAAVQLMALIDTARDEPDAIIEAACESLQRATGLPYGHNPEAWQQWWREARDQPREEWLTNLVRRLADQLSDAERQIQEEHARSNKLEKRLAEVYRDLFLRFSVEEQLDMLPDLLDDPLPALRITALDRIARLLRDSVRIPRKVQARMLARLDDDEPSIRLQVIRLLDQLNNDETPIRLVQRLEVETKREIVDAILEVLARRPAHDSSDALLQWLRKPAHTTRAAAALWAYANNTSDNNEDDGDQDGLGERVLEALSTIDTWKDSPAHVRLYGRFALRENKEVIEPLLDAASRDIRRAAAEGLIAQGWDQPVLERASDSVIQPLVLRAMSQQKPTMSALRRLATLDIESDLQEKWESSIKTLTREFATDQLLEVDELLNNAEQATVALRVEILSRIESVNANSIDADRRAATLTRLALLHLQLDQPDAALSAMEQVPEDLLVSEARRVKFEAAARNGEFDVAESLVDDVDAWIDLLNGLVERSPRTAATLHEEIQRRFRNDLDEDRQSRLDALSERLEVATDPPASDEHSPT